MSRSGPNKSKLWRRMSKKTLKTVREILPSGIMHEVIQETRYGRRLREALSLQSQKAQPTEIIAVLMKRSNIATPKFDKAVEMMHTNREAANAEIQDVEPITQGVV